MRVAGFGPQFVVARQYVGCRTLVTVEAGEVVERALHSAFRGSAVVTHHVEHQSVVEYTHVLQPVDEPAYLVVGVLEKRRVQLHQTGRDLLLVVVEFVPVWEPWSPRGQFGVRSDDAQFLLLLEGDLALAIPPVIEFADVLVQVSVRNLEWSVARAEGEIAEPRLVGVHRVDALDPFDRVVDEIL